MEHSTLFVTGMQRCGTTLLEKLLCNHPQVSVLSQPLPFLFLEAKRSFLQRIGRGQDQFPLGDLFLENAYTEAEFTRYLLDYCIDGQTLKNLFAAMESYSGQQTRFDELKLNSLIDRFSAAELLPTLSRLYREFAHKSGAERFGGKETICEEFLPYFLRRGCKCLMILRDPRDMLASLNYGRGLEYGGRLKPTLSNLRNWRKSVAYALHLQGRSGFTWIRYEDLVLKPIECLSKATEMLEVAPFTRNFFAGGVKDQSGRIWEGNSSHVPHNGITHSSAGTYKSLLPAALVSYTEAVCYPELRALGYSLSIEWPQVPQIIASFEEPYEIERTGLREHFMDRTRAAEELKRVEFLSSSGPAPVSYFLFEDVIPKLREAVFK